MISHQHRSFWASFLGERGVRFPCAYPAARLRRHVCACAVWRVFGGPRRREQRQRSFHSSDFRKQYSTLFAHTYYLLSGPSRHRHLRFPPLSSLLQYLCSSSSFFSSSSSFYSLLLNTSIGAVLSVLDCPSRLRGSNPCHEKYLARDFCPLYPTQKEEDQKGNGWTT